MAARLTNKWLEHAFPDDGPEREELLAEAAQQRREEVRRDTYLELSGADLKVRRHTSTNADNGPNGKAAKERAFDDMMMLAVGSPEYQAAYDNELSFTIDGEELEITQGELYDNANERAEYLQEQIAAAKRRGASAKEIDRLQEDLRAFKIIRDNADPRLGEVTPGRQQAIDNALAGNASAQEMVRKEGNILQGPPTKHSELPDRFDTQDDSELSVLNQWNGGRETSFAATIDDSGPGQESLALTTEFAVAKARETLEPAAPHTDDRPAPVDPGNGTGISL